MTDEAALIARRERLLGANMSLFYEHPAHIVRGEGERSIHWGGKCRQMPNEQPQEGHLSRRLFGFFRASTQRLTRLSEQLSSPRKIAEILRLYPRSIVVIGN